MQFAHMVDYRVPIAIAGKKSANVANDRLADGGLAPAG